jgi:hypothetical protein
MRRLALVVPVVLLAAGCGSPQGSASPGPGRSPRPEGPVSSSPIPPLEEIPGPGYETVVPKPGMKDVRPRPFERVKSSDDGRTLTVIYWSGVEPCNVLDHVEVKETATAVTITLYEGSDPNAGDVACIELAVKKATEIQLDEPLGDRRVKDGAK